MPNFTETCDCKEISCKDGCTRTHTHKSYDCGSCKPKLPNITETISLLDELRAGNDQVSLERFPILLETSYPTLRQAVLDGERYRKAGEAGEVLMKAVQQMNVVDEKEKGNLFCEGGDNANKTWRKLRDNALEDYRQAIK